MHGEAVKILETEITCGIFINLAVSVCVIRNYVLIIVQCSDPCDFREMSVLFITLGFCTLYVVLT